MIASNVLAGGPASRYPGGNFFPSVTQMMADFTDSSQGNYRLNPRGVPYRRAARDGTDLGVNFDQLNRVLAGLER